VSNPAGGFVLVDKPAGWTSHDVVARLRRAAGTRRVGHAGTLDPMATGLLVVGIDWATRLLTYVVGVDKAYGATIRLGQATVTDDAEGEVTATSDASALPDVAVDTAVAALTGAIAQVPSSVSAIKVDGRRAYARVRGGEQVELAARPVVVSRFDIAGRRRVGATLDLDVHVVCSSGTYVRALARDLGTALGVGGHLTALRRTRVGPFRISDAHPLADLTADGADVAAAMLPAGRAARQLLDVVVLDGEVLAAVRHGRPVSWPDPSAIDPSAIVPSAIDPGDPPGFTESGPVVAMLSGDDLVAVARRDGDLLRPVLVVPT
jgi:tRNA pseudouridine55 synthase